MTQEQLDAILAQPKPEDIVNALKVSTFATPAWADLVKQYDPEQHAIKTNLTKYPIIPNPDTGGDDMKRISRGLQKLAVDTMSQAIFVTPVERSYSFDRESEGQKSAIDIIEEVYRTQNYIDAENIERAKHLNASCQVATVWFTEEEETNIKGNVSSKSLNHASYSEMDGYKIYANADSRKNLFVISIGYTDSDDIEYLDTYINGKSPKLINFVKSEEGWVISGNETLTIFPVVYSHLKQPVWGGDTGTTQVEEIEELISYQGLYVKKNAAPLFTMDMGDTTGMEKTTDTEESDSDTRKILETGKGGKVDAVVWDAAIGAVDGQEKRLTDAFFSDNQIPDLSFNRMLNSNTSADNKDIILTGSRGKAVDLGGEWQRLFNTELNKIVIPHLKVMFSPLSADFDAISVRSVVKPYSAKSDKENAEFVATAGGAMSLTTKVRTLGKVTDVEQEVEAIEEENGAINNQL